MAPEREAGNARNLGHDFKRNSAPLGSTDGRAYRRKGGYYGQFRHAKRRICTDHHAV